MSVISGKIPVKLPLRAVIVIPFLIQIIAVVGLTGWLSFNTGNKAVKNLTTKLGNKISDDVKDATLNYLNSSYMLHRGAVSAIESGNLNVEDLAKLEKYLWTAMNEQPIGTAMEFGTEKGEFIGINRNKNEYLLTIKDQLSAPFRKIYHLDNQGNRQSLKETSEYDPRIRPWYKDAVNNGKFNWSQIYPSFSDPTLLIAATKPIYKDSKLTGVLAVEITLSQISDFLRQLKISKSGYAFIMERSGNIIATSTPDLPFIKDGNLQKQLLATNSNNPLIKATAQNLLEKFGDFKQLNFKKHFNKNFIFNGENQFIHAEQLQDKHGLDWLIVVVIPEADFMEDININVRNTILACLVALIAAILFGLQTSKWIVMPILSLNTAAKKLSEGEWKQDLPIERLDEIGELAKSFKRMGEELQESFENLEEKVQNRTAELNIANADLEKKNLLIRKVFGRYLTDEIVATILENPEGLKLGGERRKITILTSDLRGFTATSEKMPPEEVVKILNFYLHNMANVITKYHGTIDEFMGDGILVLFGAPTMGENDAIRAVACGIEMQLAMVNVNQKMQEWGLPPLEMGIGINTGEVVVGNIGSDKRTKYGIVGNHVNLTYRIESYTIGGQVIISESTFQETGSIVKIHAEKQVHSKGIQEAITIYEVGGIAGEYNLFLTHEKDVFFSLPEEIELQYTILDGKHIGEQIFSGSLIKLSSKGAEMRCNNVATEDLPLLLTNIKMQLLTPDNGSIKFSEDIYAKVLEQGSEIGVFQIHFTSQPILIREKLSAIYNSLSSNL